MKRVNWDKVVRWALQSSLTLVGLGLVVASSGIDGVYLSRFMEPGAEGLGYVMNLMGDIANPIIVYWFGRLQMDRSSMKRRLSFALLPAELVAVFFSWWFSWRQLRPRMYEVEIMPLALQLGKDAMAQVIEIEINTAVSAAYIPLLLLFVGLAQSLLAGRIENVGQAQRESSAPHDAPHVRASEIHACPICGASESSKGEPFTSQQKLAAHMRWTHTEGERAPVMHKSNGGGKSEN